MYINNEGDELISLINCYLAKIISSKKFENDYIKLWRKYRDYQDKSQISIETQKYLDMVFCAVDANCSAPLLRDENDLDELGLLSEVAAINKVWQAKK